MADIRFLGAPRMDGWDGARDAEGWKPLCLFAYLCVNLPLRLHTDTELAQLLWPRLPAGRGQRKVESAVKALNDLRPEPIVESQTDWYSFLPWEDFRDGRPESLDRRRVSVVHGFRRSVWREVGGRQGAGRSIGVKWAMGSMRRART